jgi:hypothetical protein
MSKVKYIPLWDIKINKKFYKACREGEPLRFIDNLPTETADYLLSKRAIKKYVIDETDEPAPSNES